MTTLRRVPIAGWKRCVHEAASFESPGEFKAATLLDAAIQVEWWLRNDPPLLSTNTATRSVGNTMSGLPVSALTFFRNRNPARCNALRSFISINVLDVRTLDIRNEVAAGSRGR